MIWLKKYYDKSYYLLVATIVFSIINWVFEIFTWYNMSSKAVIYGSIFLTTIYLIGSLLSLNIDFEALYKINLLEEFQKQEKDYFYSLLGFFFIVPFFILLHPVIPLVCSSVSLFYYFLLCQKRKAIRDSFIEKSFVSEL